MSAQSSKIIWRLFWIAALAIYIHGFLTRSYRGGKTVQKPIVRESVFHKNIREMGEIIRSERTLTVKIYEGPFYTQEQLAAITKHMRDISDKFRNCSNLERSKK